MRKFEDYVVQKQIDGSQNLAALANQRASLIDAITSDYKTDIMGGLLLSTLLQMRGMEADGSLKTNSGISGLTNEVNPVRFWAGDTFENRNNAPFRVRHDGSVVMEKAEVRGDIIAGAAGVVERIEVKNSDGTLKMYDAHNNVIVEINRSKKRIVLGDPGFSYDYWV